MAAFVFVGYNVMPELASLTFDWTGIFTGPALEGLIVTVTLIFIGSGRVSFITSFKQVS